MEKTKVENSAVSIGNFDGFHLGHVRIIEELKEVARQRNLRSLVLTFSPHPKILFKRVSSLIHTDEQRKRILKAQGVDRVFFIDFREVSDLSAESFVKDFLIEKFSVEYIVVGRNFRFGKNRKGDIETLKQLSGKFGFTSLVIEPEYLDGVRISSSFIRSRLMAGEVEAANRMLGHPYCIDGMVIKGEKIGRELGFPTINIRTDNTILPEGVFKTKVKVGKTCYESVTNIGTRPTFRGEEKQGKTVETHILGFSGKLYGQKVQVCFDCKIRNEIKFDSQKGLIEQIKKDIEKITGVSPKKFALPRNS
jgi:riboflavin kinase/FMN adenylyltransferase